MENKYFIQLKWLLIGSLITSTAMSFNWPLNTIYMHKTLHQTLTVAGIVLGVNQLATMLGNWLGGILFDQWSIYYTSLVGVMINILALGLLIFLNSWPIYAFLIVLSGFSNGILTTCIYSLATRVQNKKTSSIFNMLYFTSNFGLVFGTLAVGYLLKIGVSYIFTLASLTQVIFLIIVIRYFNIVNYNKGYSKKKVVVKGKFLIWSVLLALLLSWVVYTQWQSNLSAYMLGKGFSIKQYSFLWTLNAVLIITFQPVLTLFNDFLIKHIISRINVGLFLFAVAFFILLLNHNYFILGISMAFLTFGEILLFPGVASLVDIYAPNNESGIYQGLVQMFTAGGKAVGPFIGAAIIDCSNYKVLFLCLVLIIMAAIFIFSFSVYQNKRHALDQ